jgi:hypothetical protein
MFMRSRKWEKAYLGVGKRCRKVQLHILARNDSIA